MIIPNSFKQNIEDTFNDKTAYKCTSSVAISTSDGHRTITITKTSSSLKVNRLSLTRKQIREDYGFDEKVQTVLSYNGSDTISDGDYLSFLDEFYYIDEVQIFDSHKLLGMYKWHNSPSGS